MLLTFARRLLPRVVRSTEAMAEAERSTPRFFRGLAALLLAIVLLGFGKSFFLRPAFQNFSVAPIVIVHGAVMTLWFVLFAVQTFLVPAGRVRVHRAIGKFSVLVALAVVGTLIPTTYGFPSRRYQGDAPGYDFTADLEHITMVVHGNTAMLIQFVVLYGAGFLLRTQKDKHRRLMALAAISVVTPAASRLGTVMGPAGQTSEIVGILFAFGLPLVMVAYDLVMDKRLRRVTALGVGLIYSTLAVCGLIGKSPLGEAITLRLAGA